MGVFEDVQRDYPTLAWLFRHPEVGRLLRDAVDTTPFSGQEFQAKLYQTKWFRQRSQARREFEILSNVDPGEIRRRVNIMSNRLRTQFSQLGYKATKAEIRYIGTAAVRDGIDVDDPGNLTIFRSLLMKPSNKFTHGAILTNMRKIKETAERDYFMGYGGGLDKKWGVDLALGLKTEEDMKRDLTLRAISYYPHLKEQLNQGYTMSQLFDGHRQVIAEELELDPESIQFRLTKGQWGKVLKYYDPKLKKDRALTTSETRTLARQDPRFWNTSNGRQMGAGMSQFLLEKFGQRA